MKLSLGKAHPTSTSDAVDHTAATDLAQLESLYARMRDNPYADSESLRQTILASMLMLIAGRLYRSKP